MFSCTVAWLQRYKVTNIGFQTIPIHAARAKLQTSETSSWTWKFECSMKHRMHSEWHWLYAMIMDQRLAGSHYLMAYCFPVYYCFKTASLLEGSDVQTWLIGLFLALDQFGIDAIPAATNDSQVLRPTFPVNSTQIHNNDNINVVYR